MRILLTSNASYIPARGGSTRSNLVWLAHLAEHGHACRVVCASIGEDAEDTVAGIEIHSVKYFTRRRTVLEKHIREFNPDFVLVSSERGFGQNRVPGAHAAIFSDWAGELESGCARDGNDSLHARRGCHRPLHCRLY
jgi:hypothetical protein